MRLARLHKSTSCLIYRSMWYFQNKREPVVHAEPSSPPMGGGSREMSASSRLETDGVVDEMGAVSVVEPAPAMVVDQDINAAIEAAMKDVDIAL